MLVRFTGEFLISALLAGDSAVVLATNAHQRAIGATLHRRGIDVAQYAHEGKYFAVDAQAALAECLDTGVANFSRLRRRIHGILADANRAATTDHPRAMVFGELVSLLWGRRDCEALLELESVWENLALEHSFTLFCGYSIKQFSHAGSEAAFLKVCAAHATMVPPDRYPTDESERRILAATALPL